jgi:RHS repeat-associated protein
MFFSAAFDMTYQFTGKERDAETGLDYFGARYYSGAQGRFMSPDEFNGGPDDALTGKDIIPPGPLPYADVLDPQTINKYCYVRNNPLKYIDPDGHDILYANEALKARYDEIAEESNIFKEELRLQDEDHNLTVNVVERGVRVNEQKSRGDATIRFLLEGKTEMTVYIDSKRTSKSAIVHETGHGKDARTNREQLKQDTLKTERLKGSRNAIPYDERPEEERANKFKKQVEDEIRKNLKNRKIIPK